MNNPFENKAIKFETEQELNHLAELARGCGLEVSVCFYDDYIFFRKDIFSDKPIYYNYNSNGKIPEITYSDFIASLHITEIDYSTEVMKIHPEATVYTGTMGKKIKIGDNETPYFTTFFDAWRSAYQMMQPTPNHTEQQPDMVNHPPHYTVNGIEVIDVIENYKLNYRLGNVVKYVLRADLKGNRLQDLKKALWYLQREIEQSEKQK